MTGFKDRKNIYHCRDCGGYIVTVDRDDGVTPFAIGCHATPGCAGMMESGFYRVSPRATAGFEWYRMSNEEAAIASPGMREHHRKGGLALRPIAPD